MYLHNITLIPGDGIGPEITKATLDIIEASGVSINWEEVSAGEKAFEEKGTPLPDEVFESIKRNKVALKGPLTTPVGSGYRSLNVAMRKSLDLYVNLRPARSLKGIKSRYEDIDLVVVRENTEDIYVGVEHMVGEDAAESIKIITRKGSERIVRYAFEYAIRENRKKVTAVHKANIMKYTDGLFLDVAREVASEYPQIEFEDKIVDNMSMQLVQKPELYDVLVMPNLYGDILSDICAGLVGGLGVVPGANIGDGVAIFEPAHGTAPKYAGKNVANPMALLLSGVLMLEHLGEVSAANKITSALQEVLVDGGSLTQDLGGSASTSEFAQAIISKM
ncbi:MAG: isocitrate dehydrogenase (NAD(+)) [Clostridia bacterium]|nr:isocitrate dehydrogenase (NAD(+)) [Clostridia bacterium]